MLNIEFWKDKLTAIRVAGEFFAVRKGMPCICTETPCECCDFSEETCGEKAIQWLLEEHKEPEIYWPEDIDWAKVPADTAVIVGDIDGNDTYDHFAVYVPNADRKYMTFFGAKQRDATRVASWKYCKLANEEDIEKYRKRG